MKIYLLILIAYLPFPVISLAQKKSANHPLTITADSVQRSMLELMDELAKKHPGFYRYNSKPAFKNFIDSTLSTIRGPQDELSYYRKLKILIARIRCVHTTVALPVHYSKQLDESANLIPLAVFFAGDRAYITASYSGSNDIVPGMEILSINGQPMVEIKKILFAGISTDGFNETLKYQLVNNRFAQSYRNNIAIAKQFKILINTPNGTIERILEAVKADCIPVPQIMDLKDSPRLNVEYDGSTAFLTIHSFGDTEVKAGGQSFKKFVSKTFSEINNKHIKNLIIDLRNNTGGTDINAAYLCSYLMQTPYRYWDRIEVTEPFALSLKGSAKLMYGKPIKQDSIYLWRKSKFTREFDFFEPQQPQANPFTGSVYILINGACLSSCADLTAVLQHNKRATFIGEETGGGYQGNNSGLIPDSEITFGLTVSVPLLKYLNAVDPATNIGHGTMPDINYRRTFSDVIQKKDPEMEIAKKLAIKE